MLIMADTTVDATRRLNVKKQTLDDAYAAPANFLEIDVINPETHGVGKKRYTDYEVRMRVSESNSDHFAYIIFPTGRLEFANKQCLISNMQQSEFTNSRVSNFPCVRTRHNSFMCLSNTFHSRWRK